jgi:hypothetical protein
MIEFRSPKQSRRRHVEFVIALKIATLSTNFVFIGPPQYLVASTPPRALVIKRLKMARIGFY